MKALPIAAVAALALAPAMTLPAARAVTPPPVDETLLPAAGPPGPPHRTTRFGDCVASDPGAAEPATAGQLAGLDLAAVWDLTRGAGQTVAVIDTGVARHRRLPRLVPGGDYVSTGDGTSDCDGHGTAVAGIIGATTDSAAGGFTGIAPDAAILAIRQSSNKFRAGTDPAGTGYGDVATLASAVRTAADLGATVVNISSVACLAADGTLDDRALGAALAYAVDVRNAVVVSAAGNVGGPGQCPGNNPPESGDWNSVAVVASPAWYDDYVLTVGSVGPEGSPSAFSLAGPWVDVAAPGEGVVSLTATGEGTVQLSGTSYAAPVVSGVAALVRARFPELTARQVMQRIEDTALRPGTGWNPFVGHGVVDPLAAVSGGRPTRPVPSPAPIESVSAPVDADGAAGRTAVRAAVVCIAVAGAVAVLSAGRNRSRLRGRAADAVPGD